METKSDAAARVRPNELALWFGNLGGAVAWALHLHVLFVISPWICGLHTEWPIHVASLALLTLTAWAGIVSAVHWHKSPRVHEHLEAAPDRARFMAVIGTLINIFFFLVILAQWIPVFVVDPCLK
ncbi:MAG TPA: hypothetical protein VJ063_18970 [Verrucomicrobiae bacterium]|nr:hypothetical protein [Verrucomicrobiae bacterium]